MLSRRRFFGLLATIPFGADKAPAAPAPVLLVGMDFGRNPEFVVLRDFTPLSEGRVARG